MRESTVRPSPDLPAPPSPEARSVAPWCHGDEHLLSLLLLASSSFIRSSQRRRSSSAPPSAAMAPPPRSSRCPYAGFGFSICYKVFDELCSIAYMKQPKQNFPTGYLLGKFVVSKEVCSSIPSSTPCPLLNDDDQWLLSSVIGCYMSSLACNLSTRLSASRCSRPGKVNLCGERHQGKSGPGRKSSKVARSPKQNVVFAAPWSDWMVLVVSCQYPSEL